jgi:hypothetical protein
MASVASHTIILKGSGIQKERLAGGTIRPGHLLQLGSTNAVVVHAGAAKNAAKMFAKENEVIGKDIDTTYASGENVIYEVCHAGMEVYALVPASAAAIVIGDYLESNGDGTLKKQATDAATDDTQRVSTIAIALEAVDNSGGGSPARIRVEVL